MDFTLDQSKEEIEFTSAEQNRQLALSLAQLAKHEILIASYDLDNRIYSNQPFVDALSSFVRGHRNAHVDIIVWQTNPAVKNGHRLIDLAQRLSSSIRIHQPDKVHAGFIESYMVVDGIAYFRRQQADRADGVGCLHAPLIARDLKAGFHAMWERSTPCSEFRRLRI